VWHTHTRTRTPEEGNGGGEQGMGGHSPQGHTPAGTDKEP